MPTRLRSAPHLTLIAVAAAGFLAGCSPAETPTKEKPSESAEPYFASDEEALATAEAALDVYWAAFNRFLQEGGSNPEQLRELVTDDWYDGMLDTSRYFTAGGIHQEGQITTTQSELQQWYTTGTSVIIVVTTCADFTQRSIASSEGIPVDLADTPDSNFMQTTLSAESEGPFLVQTIDSRVDQPCSQ